MPTRPYRCQEQDWEHLSPTTTIIMVFFLAYRSQPTTQVTPPAWELSLPFLFPAEDLGHSGDLILRSGLCPHLPFSQVASVNTGCAIGGLCLTCHMDMSMNLAGGGDTLAFRKQRQEGC